MVTVADSGVPTEYATAGVSLARTVSSPSVMPSAFGATRTVVEAAPARIVADPDSAS